MVRIAALLAALVLLAPATDLVTLSIVGTTDLHGFAFPRDGRGGVAMLGGFVGNLRQARSAEGGAVLLLDAGDTYQGGIESNLSEGALVVDAYNALGYTAAAIGNHDFEFGPVDGPGARQPIGEDLRGALKARAAQARYPLLAANLIDEATGDLVQWPNVHPSVLVESAGVKVGLIGVMTIDALRATLPVNVQGLRTAPLVPAISREARGLRDRGAELVVVVAHAGGSCASFNDPSDLSSCDDNSEIFDVARGLPPGLVDLIVAGHTHDAVAHRVAGVTIVQAYSMGRAFARADVVVDRQRHRVVSVTPFAPRDLCLEYLAGTDRCASSSTPPTARSVARYEGRAVADDIDVNLAMAPRLAAVRALQATSLDVTLEQPLGRAGNWESPLGNLFADAMRERTPGTDVAINNNSRGGLRADLPAGALTFGRLYDVFPFDNRLVTLTLTGAELQRIFGDEVRRNRRNSIGVSGIRVATACGSDGLLVNLYRPSGQPVRPDERLTIVTMDMLAAGQFFAPAFSRPGFAAPPDAPVAREVVEDWLDGHPISARQFVDPDRPRWDVPSDLPCQ